MTKAQQIHTPESIAEALHLTKRRVQQLIKKLGIVPEQMVGRTPVLAAKDVRRIKNRKLGKRGPAKKK